MSTRYRSSNMKNNGRVRPAIQLSNQQSTEIFMLISTKEKKYEVIAPNVSRTEHSEKFTVEGWLLDEDLFFNRRYRFYVNTYGWAQCSVEMAMYKKRGYLPDKIQFYNETPLDNTIYLMGYVDECKTYGQRFSAALMRTAVLGRELSIVTTFAALQTNNQTYCENRDITDPLRPCSSSCNCKKTVVYDVHELNLIALLKVSLFNKFCISKAALH